MSCAHVGTKIRFNPRIKNHSSAECHQTKWAPCRKSHFNLKCERPIQWLCKVCGSYDPAPCGSTKKNYCTPCAQTWVSRQRSKIRYELMRSPNWTEITLTREGEKEFPWDIGRCRIKYPHKHSGKKGCKNFDADVAIANEKTTLDYSHWVTYVRRKFPNHDLQFVRVYEVHKRGTLHIHIVVIGLPPLATKTLRKKIVPINKKWGFGVRKGFHIKTVSQNLYSRRESAVAYLTKYLTKDSEVALLLNSATGELRGGGYRRISYTRRFSLPMRDIKLLRREEYLARTWAEALNLLGEHLGATPVRASEGGAQAPPLITAIPVTQPLTLF